MESRSGALEEHTTGLKLTDDPRKMPTFPDEACFHGKATKADSQRKADADGAKEPNLSARRITETVYLDFHDYGKDLGDYGNDLGAPAAGSERRSRR